ncbi:MAG: efflux RND transporter permease subunit [Candidatus Sumerlaeota bacterium]
MSLPRFALSAKSIVLSIAVALSFWGLYVFQNAPRREDPEFHVRTALVSCVWPGAPVRDVELLLTDPLEEAVSEVEEVKETRSYTRTGQSVIYVDLAEYIDDTDNAWDEITARIERVDIPRGAFRPVLNRAFGDTSVMLLAIHSQGEKANYTPAQLHAMAKRVRDRLYALPDVAAVRLHGVREERVYVQTDMKTWSQIGLTTGELQELVEARNIVVPGGMVETGGLRFGVKPTGDLDAAEQLRRLVVAFGDEKPRPGAQYPAPVYLEDVGLSVERSYADPPGVLARYLSAEQEASSREAVYLSFTMKDDANATELGREVNRLIRELEATILPPDVALTVVADQPEVVRQKIRTFLSNLVQAVVIVIILAFLLLGFRIAVVMASAVPIVMLIAIGISHFFGVDIEQVAIASLIIALGLLVDNAIEVGDNTLRLLEEGYDRETAARLGPEQVGMPMLFGTLTTVAAFFPMLSIPGTTGEFIYSLPVVVSITLLTSWVIAMTVTTIMSYWMIRPTHGGAGRSPLMKALGLIKRLFKRGKKQESDENIRGDIGALRRLYGALCMVSIRLRWVVVPLAFVLFAISIWLVASGRIGTEFFPPNHRAQFTIDIFTPEGTSLRGTDRVVRKVERLLRETSDMSEESGERIERLDNAMVLVGVGGPRFYTGRAPEPPAPNYAFILVNTTSADVVSDYIEELRRKAKEEIPGSRIIPRPLMYGPPVEAPIAIRYVGEDIETLRSAAEETKNIFRRTRGAWDIHDSWGVYSYQLRVEVDEERANLAGVSNASIARSTSAYYSGFPLSTFREGDKKIPIMFRLIPEEQHSLDDIERLYVEGRHGKVPLGAVAEVESLWQPSKIQRIDGRRMIEVRSRVYPAFLANAVLHRAMEELEQLNGTLPPTVSMEIAGEQKETTESQRDVSRAFKISIVLIVLLLVMKFNAFGKALVILLTVPLAGTGAFFGLYLTGVPLGFMANLGLLSLVGVILNDAILLIEFIEMECEKARDDESKREKGGVAGLSREAFREAVVRAGRTRLIPLSLTSLTTVGGLIPLLLFGGPMWSPLCIVLIFGLLIGTALALLVFPPAFVISAERFGLRVLRNADLGATSG